MKKFLIYSLSLFAVSMGFVSCSEDDDVPVGADRKFMTMFRCDNNTGKGDSDPYNCAVVDLNDVHLYWYGVEGAYGYQIRWALQPNVSGGAQAWHETDSLGLLSGDTIIVGADVLDMVIKDLNYQTDYRFAIRTLNSADLNDPKNSKWYGHGDGRGWAEYLGLQTGARYEVPSIIQVSDITKTSMRVNLNRSTAGYSDEQLLGFKEHFTIEGDVFKVDYLTITPSKSSPNATVPAGFEKYILTDEDWTRGYVDVEGLTENAVYNIDVWDGDIKVSVDANYNPLLKRTKGTAGPAILIEHKPNATDTIGTGENANVYDISEYNSMKLDQIIIDYCQSMELAENQVFYLEAGKTYHFTSNPSVYKGFTLRTDPEGFAKTGEKATLYLSGMTQTGTTINTCNFMLGRQPQPGENSTIPIDIDSVRFMDLNVNVPLAKNYGHSVDGSNYGAVGNYFMNMYSNGMGINVTLLEWNNCTFQGLIRGFFRIQGSNDFNIHKLVLKDCEFLNTGFYDNGGKGYNIIFADHNGKPKSNILENVIVENNTFVNTPHGSIITDNNRNLVWDESVRWNITVTNNTFINHATRSAIPFFNFRYMPGGSVLTIKNNFWTVTKDEADALRPLNCQGCDIRTIQGGDGTGNVTFDIANNWSTNNNLTSGQICSKGSFSAKSNAPGKFLATSNFPSGAEELEVHVDDISATELMVSPNPKYYVMDPSSHMEHHTDNLDGIYFQNTDKVRNSNIYKLGIGAPKWRQLK